MTYPTEEKTEGNQSMHFDRHSQMIVFHSLWICCLLTLWVMTSNTYAASQRSLTFEITEDVSLKFAIIPAGKSPFGSPENESGRLTEEPVQTTQSIDYSFWMATTETLANQVTALIPSRNRVFNLLNVKPEEPARFVNWSVANRWCRLMNEQLECSSLIPKGYIFRLPLETEWEHACRAGKQTPFGTGNGNELNDNLAYFSWNFPYASKRTAPNPIRPGLPAQYPANDWNLHDMHGSIWEMCLNAYSEYLPEINDKKDPDMTSWITIRGGAWTSSGRFCRASSRVGFPKGGFRDNVGFRVVLAPKTPEYLTEN